MIKVANRSFTFSAPSVLSWQLVTGPRQSGKTTFLRHEVAERYRYVSFDDPLERDFALTDPNGFLRAFDDSAALLDEVQHVPELLSYIKLRIDAAPDRLGRWVLTGSQQFALMQQLGESLAGRVAILELLPFSGAELAPPDLARAIGAGAIRSRRCTPSAAISGRAPTSAPTWGATCAR